MIEKINFNNLKNKASEVQKVLDAKNEVIIPIVDANNKQSYVTTEYDNEAMNLINPPPKNLLKEVLGNAVVDIVDNHTGTYGAVQQALKDGYLDKTKPLTIIHPDPHSDLYTRIKNQRIGLADYLNHLCVDNNVSDIYWVLPEETIGTVVQSAKNNFSNNRMDALGGNNLKELILYSDNNAKQIFVTPDKDNPNDYNNMKRTVIHILTKENLPSFKGKSNIVADIDWDYFQNNGFDTSGGVEFHKTANELEQSSTELLQAFKDKSIKPDLVVLARSRNYSVPKGENREASFNKLEQISYQFMGASKLGVDYLTVNPFDEYKTDKPKNLNLFKPTSLNENAFTFEQLKSQEVKQNNPDYMLVIDKNNPEYINYINNLAKTHKISRKEAALKVEQLANSPSNKFLSNKNIAQVAHDVTLIIDASLSLLKFVFNDLSEIYEDSIKENKIIPEKKAMAELEMKKISGKIQKLNTKMKNLNTEFEKQKDNPDKQTFEKDINKLNSLQKEVKLLTDKIFNLTKSINLQAYKNSEEWMESSREIIIEKTSKLDKYATIDYMGH